MKLGLVCTLLKKEHHGGKDEVAYNILRGFKELGYDKDVVVFCRPEVEDIILSISSNFVIVKIIFLAAKYPKNKIKRIIAIFYRLLAKAVNFIECQVIEFNIRQKGIDVLLFMNKDTPKANFSVKTAFITHDLRAFAGDILKGEIDNEIGRRKYLEQIANDCKYRDVIIAISDFDRAQIKKYLPQYYEKSVRIYDPIRFPCIMEKGGNRQYITAINIQWPHKNTITLVKAFIQIADKVSYSLILVGRKPQKKYMDEMEEVIERSSYAERIIFTGYVDQKQLDDIISRTRIYVNPSLWEGFGMTAVEMMGNEVPTIIANTSAALEVTLGLCQYYEPATSVNALTAAIMSELNRETDQNKLHDIALQIREKYDYINVARQYWNEMNKLANEWKERD